MLHLTARRNRKRINIMPQTTEQVLRQQAQEAARNRAAAANRDTRPKGQLDLGDKANSGALATRPTTSAPAARTPQQKYLDEIAPSSIAGQLVKFSKDGKFVVSESGEVISPDKDFVALCDDVLVGWIKFGDQGEPPDRVQGLHYDGFIMPERETLGELDPSAWPEGLDGHHADPWQHQICLVLQDRESLELYTFATSSITGRRAVGNLLRHFERLRRAHPDMCPIVRLKPGGYESRKKGVGWVHTPTFVVVGRAPRDSAAKPDSSNAADMNDEFPF
jgi:hypothetical protein